MTRIRIVINGQDMTAKLDDTPVARDFASLLPMTLTLDDYAKKEKVSDLPKRLETQEAPAGYAPKAGDLTYYAPWGNLAIFYEGFSYSAGLVRLGEILGPHAALTFTGEADARFEIVD